MYCVTNQSPCAKQLQNFLCSLVQGVSLKNLILQMAVALKPSISGSYVVKIKIGLRSGSFI